MEFTLPQPDLTAIDTYMAANPGAEKVVKISQAKYSLERLSQPWLYCLITPTLALPKRTVRLVVYQNHKKQSINLLA